MGKRTCTIILLCLGLMLCTLTGGVQAEEQILLVPQDFSTVQEAIDTARDGDRIVVAQGIYRERINFSGKNIVLTSTDPDNSEVVAHTVLEGEGNGTVVRIELGESSKAVLSGFTIQGGRSRRGGGVLVAGYARPVIEYNVIRGNLAQERGGGIFIHRSSPMVRHNLVIDNTSNLGGAGIDVCSGSSPLIEGNTVIRNRAHLWGGGMYVVNSQPVILNNSLEENHAGEGGGLFVNSMSIVFDEEKQEWPRQNRPPFEDRDPGGNIYRGNTQGDPPAQEEGSQVWFD